MIQRTTYRSAVRLFLLFIACVAVFGANSCRTADTGKTVVTFWGLGAEGENVKAMIPEFEGLHPDITVRVQQIPWTGAHEKLLTSYAGNSSPDICQLGNTWVPEFSLLNALEDLSPWVARSPSVHTSDYFPGILATNTIDSVLYGIPWYVDTRVLFYRKDILARAGYPDGPRTWTELRDACEKIVARKYARFGIFMPVTEWAPPAIFGIQNGSTLLKNNDTEGDFSAPAFRDAFRFYISFFTAKIGLATETDISNLYQSFSDGYFAMYITGPWNIGEFSSRLPRALQEKWMTSPLPSPDSSYPGASLAGGASLVMFRSSRNKEAAWKFIEFLSKKDVQLRFYRMTGNLPALREAWKDTSLSANVYARAFLRQFDRVVPTPKVPEWEQIAMKMQDYAEAAAKQVMTVEQALHALDGDVNRMLEKRRWMIAQRKHK